MCRASGTQWRFYADTGSSASGESHEIHEMLTSWLGHGAQPACAAPEAEVLSEATPAAGAYDSGLDAGSIRDPEIGPPLSAV